MKKILLLLILWTAISYNFSFANSPNIVVGINNSGMTMKPLTVSIKFDEDYQLGDQIILSNGIYQTVITIDKATLEEKLDLKSTLYIEDAQTPLLYKHMRGDAVIETQEISCYIQDGIAVGVLSPLSTVNIETENTVVYTLDIDHLSPDYLNMLDILYIDNFYVETLSENNTNNILQWLSKGGTILINSNRSNNQAYTGFLSSMKDKKSIAYNFGLIANIDDLNGYLKDFQTHNTYPKIDTNNYRSIAKEGLVLEKKSLSKLLVMTLLLSTIGIILIWLPNFKKTYLMASYLALTVLTFIILNMTYSRALASITTIAWSKDQATKSIDYLHTIQDTSADLALAYEEGFSLFKQSSQDEATHVIYREAIDQHNAQASVNDLTLKDDLLTGHYTWHKAVSAQKAVLLIADQIVPIGQLEKDQSLNIAYQLQPYKADTSDYERQIQLVKNAGWSMDESLLFNEFQTWYQSSCNFTRNQAFLIAWSSSQSDMLINHQIEKVTHNTLYIEEFKLQGGDGYE